MKKIFTFIMLCALSLVAVAQTATTMTKPQALKTLMAKEHLSNTLQSMQQPARQQAKLVAEQPATWTATTYTAAKAPAQLTGLDTTEVYFTSFYEDPYYTPADTVVGRNGNTVITLAEWYFVLRNERYQFNFDIINNTKSTTLAGTYTEKDLEEWFSWCMFPEANGDTHYYKTCDLTIKEEKVSDHKIKYIVDAVILATCGIGGEEYGYFKVHAEHEIVIAKSKLDVALYNCTMDIEEDRWRINGKDSEVEVDLTFFTETGVEGYYSHKLMDDENSKIVHKGVEKGIMELDGIIYGAENIYGSLTYIFMFEALTTDTCFYNVAMEAPVLPKDTIEITCTNAIINDMYGISDQTILVDASTNEYEINAAYNATSITTPAEYPTGSSYVYLTDLKTGQQIESIVCNLKITGNKLEGYQVEITMFGTDYKYYIMHLSYGVPEVQETKVLDFKENAKTMYYIHVPILHELQMANFNGEYSVSFDFLYIDQVMGGEFDMTNMFDEQTFLIHHVVENGEAYDVPVKFAEFGGKIWQENDTTFLTASILGFDSIQYEISMFYAVPAPTETVTYTFDGLGDDVVDLTNAVSLSGIFVLDAMSADGQLMAKVNVERIEDGTIAGTYYNDGKFDHSDFYPVDTWVKVWNAATKEYDEYSVQKGTMTVKQEGDVVTAVASFICDNAVQYDLTFITNYTREHLAFDSEEGEVDYTYAPNSYYEFTTDYVESHNQLYFDILAADYSNVTALVFFVDKMDSEITIPEGVYPINKSMALGTVYASPGVAVGGGPIQSYFCYTIVQEDGIYFDQEGLYCLVDGTVTVEKVDGKLKIDVDAVNSYDLPVKLHYTAAGTAVENVTTDETSVVKRLVNGQLFIQRGGKIFNAQGAQVE